jgi:hypothetical protein
MLRDDLDQLAWIPGPLISVPKTFWLPFRQNDARPTIAEQVQRIVDRAIRRTLAVAKGFERETSLSLDV